MTREQELLDKALRILGDKARNDRATVRQIKLALGHVSRQKNARASGRYGVLTKQQKAAAGQVVTALIMLRTNLNSWLLEWRNWFPWDDFDFDKWIARANAEARTEILKKNPPDHAKRYAAKVALQLLQQYNLPAPTTSGKQWDKLTAILYGDPKVDCHNIIRRLKPDR
jgi:hypothetical protein